jgi:hypothetical protein
MLFCITNAIKKKLCLIFQDILSKHPVFEKVQVYTKFPETERPKNAIVIRAASANSQKLAINNFITTDHSFCTLANLKGIEGNSIEWVKDDVKNIDKLSPPGFYIVKIISHEENTNKFQFKIDQYLICDDEILDLQFIKNTVGAVLKNAPINPKSEIIHSQNNDFDFKPNIDYTIDYSTGEILFKSDVHQYAPITVDYQILGAEQGPFTTEYYYLDNKSIPGVILAFGERLKVGDEQVVFLDMSKTASANVFGGRWQLGMSVQVISQSPDQQERLADYIISAFWADYQMRLTDEGISILDFAISAESENLEHEITDEYSFTADINFTTEVDWELHYPIIKTLRRISIAYGLESYKDKLDDVTQNEYEIRQFDDRMIGSKHHQGLQLIPSLNPYTTQPSVFPNVQSRQY